MSVPRGLADAAAVGRRGADCSTASIQDLQSPRRKGAPSAWFGRRLSMRWARSGRASASPLTSRGAVGVVASPTGTGSAVALVRTIAIAKMSFISIGGHRFLDSVNVCSQNSPARSRWQGVEGRRERQRLEEPASRPTKEVEDIGWGAPMVPERESVGRSTDAVVVRSTKRCLPWP